MKTDSDKSETVAEAKSEATLAAPSCSANALQAATEAWVMAVQKYYEREPNRSELTQVFMRGYFAGWSEREVAQLADKLADNAKRIPSWPNAGTQRPGDAEATNATRATPPGSLE